MKIAIVIKEDLDKAMYANAAACIASGLFHQEGNLIGDHVSGKDCTFIPITKIPILILRQNNKPFSELLKRAKRKKLKYMVFTNEAQSTTSYEEYVNRVKDKGFEEIEVIGIGVLGEDDSVNKFRGDLPLYRGDENHGSPNPVKPKMSPKYF